MIENPSAAESSWEGSSDGSPVKVLWTGGWDSSFRVMELLLVEHRAVQPIYVLNLKRKSASNELRAMDRMRQGLRERMANPSLLRPTHVVVAQDIPLLGDLVRLRERILEKTWVGTQYVMLGSIAEALGWKDVEICMQAQEGGAVTGLHRLVFADERGGRLTHAPEAQLFKYWSFPLLHVPKSEMAVTARQHGFYDLLVQRWFCHYPVFDKPCGRCNPCRLANPEGVEFADPRLVWAVRRAERARRRADRLLGRT